ncbi:MAG: hypothetical protein ACRDSP_21805 [Pseudonocardiaceae bacterium]
MAGRRALAAVITKSAATPDGPSRSRCWVDHGYAPCPARRVVIGVAARDRVEADLASGAISCPGSGGPLRARGAMLGPAGFET